MSPPRDIVVSYDHCIRVFPTVRYPHPTEPITKKKRRLTTHASKNQINLSTPQNPFSPPFHVLPYAAPEPHPYRPRRSPPHNTIPVSPPPIYNHPAARSPPSYPYSPNSPPHSPPAARGPSSLSHPQYHYAVSHPYPASLSQVRHHKLRVLGLHIHQQQIKMLNVQRYRHYLT